MAMWYGHRAPYGNLDLTEVAVKRNQFLRLRMFARKLTCSQADSGVPMRTQSQLLAWKPQAGNREGD